MDRRRRIGLIIANINDIYASKFLPGFLKHAFELNYDCAIFSYSIKEDIESDLIYGASNIFNLINADKIDAIVIVPDEIKNKTVVNKVVERIREIFIGPVVSADIDLKCFPTVSTNDTALIEAICDHLIEKHGYTTIDFMNGVKGHEHSIRRLEGYKRSLEKHGIKFDENRVYDGDYWYTMGEATVEKIMNSGRPLPQAVMCAADSMAISVVEAFKKRNISVPDQVAVTGYDSSYDTIDYVPSITSALLPAHNTGYNAVEYIHCMLEKKPYNEVVFKDEIIVAQSCGCGVDAYANYRSKEFICTDTVHLSPFRSITNYMMSDLIAVDTIEEIISKIKKYTYQIEPFTNFYLCLCDDWRGIDTSDQKGYRRQGYSDKITVAVECKHTDELSDEGYVFDKKIMLPDMDTDKKYPSAYFFSALNFRDRCFGYTVLKFENEVRVPPYDYRDWLIYVCNSFECIRRQLHIKRMYKKLEIAALTDGLTKLYNRNAFNMHVTDMMNSAALSPIHVLFIMADLNYLKTINDKYGHLYGDQALIAVGKAIMSACGDSEKSYRFGGDEFMIIGVSEYTDERIRQISDNIHTYLSEYNNSSDNPFNVVASLGIVYTEINEYSKIDDIISTADNIMYQNKIKYKQSHGQSVEKN